MQCTCAILSLWPYRLYHIFSKLSHKRRDFRRKEKFLNIKYVFWFSVQLLSEELSQTCSIMYIGLHVNYRLSLADCNETWTSLTDFRKCSQTSNLMKIRPVGAELFHLGGRTDRHDEANSAFSQFCEGSCKLIPSPRCSPQPTAHSLSATAVCMEVFWTCSGPSYLALLLSVNGSVSWHHASGQCHLSRCRDLSCNLATAATLCLLNGRSLQSKQSDCRWPSLDESSVRALWRLGAGTSDCKLLVILTVCSEGQCAWDPNWYSIRP
jgi:hypothetical protein